MQHAVGFEQPAGLRADEIGQRPAGQRQHAGLNRLAPDSIYRPGLLRVDQGVFDAHVHLALEHGKAQRDGEGCRRGRTNLHQPGERRKPFAGHLNFVSAERQLPGDGLPLRVGLERAMHLVRLADELHRALDRKAARIADRHAQLARVARRKLREHQRQNAAVEHGRIPVLSQ